jgi:hypothetical protein
MQQSSESGTRKCSCGRVYYDSVYPLHESAVASEASFCPCGQWPAWLLAAGFVLAMFALLGAVAVFDLGANVGAGLVCALGTLLVACKSSIDSTPATAARSIPESKSSPFLSRHLTQQIFGYVGPGHWLFLATIDKHCKEVYERIEHVLMPARIRFEDRLLQLPHELITCTPQMTLMRAVFASPSCLRLAVRHGLCLHDYNAEKPQLQLIGRYGDIDTLREADNLGMLLYYSTLSGATETGSLAKVQALVEELGCIIKIHLY